jgi:hypothetical protein
MENIEIFIRFAKRFAVFLPGVAIAYLSFRYALPFFDKRLPVFFGALITYVLAAYLVIPGLIRAFRIFHPPKHLPLYCITPDGFASDPLNVGLIGTKQEIIETMHKAGWHLADPMKPQSLFKHICSVVIGTRYLTAPMSNLYMFGRKQDLAFQMSVNGTSVNRHHVRFWATTYNKKSPLTISSIHWHKRRAHVSDDKLLWVGAASLDIGIMPIRHNMQLTHMVHPNTNQERELIVDQLKDHRLIRKIEQVKLGNPYRLINRTWRGELHTDGRMTVVWPRCV